MFLNELADMNDAEHRITKALPKMMEAATCGELQDALENHLEETENQIDQLERGFELIEEKPRTKKCPAMVGILDEGDEIVAENKESPSINAAIIAACQKVEHYEIATYGTLCTWAKLLGSEPAAEILQEILDQEKEADQNLTDLSLAKNEEALEEAPV